MDTKYCVKFNHNSTDNCSVYVHTGFAGLCQIYYSNRLVSTNDFDIIYKNIRRSTQQEQH